MKKCLLYGVGIRDVDYVVEVWETIGYVDGKQKQKRVWVCPFFQAWKNMLERGYSEKLKTRNPTYREVEAIEDWLRLSKFKSWMEKQDWEGKQLDKDLLFPGNKIYGPETCIFVSKQVNMFLTDSGASRGQYMIGVCWNKARDKFQAQCCNPFTKKQEKLGSFTTELEAHKAWLAKKVEHANALAALQTDERVAKALIDRYENYKVEK